MRAELIEEAVIEHFRAVWLSPAGRKALRKAIEKLGRQRDRDKPNRLKEYESRLAKLDQQIARGVENLLLVDPGDVPGLKRILAGWREEREAVQAAFEGERKAAAEPPELDADAILAELEHLEDSLTAENLAVAKAAFGRSTLRAQGVHVGFSVSY